MLFGGLLLSAVVFAQKINGSIKDGQGNGINNATVSLLHAKDSSVSKLSITKGDGQYSFDALRAGKYLVTTSHVGYNSVYSAAFEFDGGIGLGGVGCYANI